MACSRHKINIWNKSSMTPLHIPVKERKKEKRRDGPRGKKNPAALCISFQMNRFPMDMLCIPTNTTKSNEQTRKPGLTIKSVEQTRKHV